MSLIDGKEFDLLNADANLSGEKVNDEVSPDTSTKYDQVVKKENSVLIKQPPSVLDFVKDVVTETIQTSVWLATSFVKSIFGMGDTSSNNRAKRKRPGVGDEDVSDEEDECEEGEIKRWRPDTVLQAVEKFIKAMWIQGREEKQESGENENSLSDNDAITSSSSKPGLDINFISDSIVSDIHDVHGKGKSIIIN